MKLNFLGDLDTVSRGIDALLPELGCALSDEGIPVVVQQRPGNLVVSFEEGTAQILYAETHHFFRGLGLLVERLSPQLADGRDAAGSASLHLTEHPQFRTLGPMFDVSRNAVLSLDTCQLMLRKIALMGMNAAMLYMEDVYEIADEPYFGYMRGRYTVDEIHSIVAYAEQFGIEVIPSIQTLAHLEQFLRWEAAADYRDTRGVLLVDAERTYALIDKMLGALSAAFKTRRIHLGMDESEELGRGRHLDQYGYEDRFAVFTRHLTRVLDIVKKHQLEPMMWSDMLIKLASGSGDDYYGEHRALPEHIVAQTPKDVQMVYWDYYHTQQEHYERLIQLHKQFGTTPAFAGGYWIWNTLGANARFSMKALETGLKACKAEGVEDVYITLWGDDGNESNVLYALAGLQLAAEYAYHAEPGEEAIRERVKFVTGIAYDAFMHLTDLDETPGTELGNPTWDNPSKFLLWQDLLMGLFDKQIEGVALSQHYQKLEETIRRSRSVTTHAPGGATDLSFIFDVPEKLCAVLAVKSELGIQIKQAYDTRDREALRHMAEVVLPDLANKVEALREAHRTQWFQTFKPFGWEVIDIRYGGLLARIQTARQRLRDYSAGGIDRIEELDQARLPFNHDRRQGLGRSGYYFMTASANAFFHVLPIS